MGNFIAEIHYYTDQGILMIRKVIFDAGDTDKSLQWELTGKAAIALLRDNEYVVSMEIHEEE